MSYTSQAKEEMCAQSVKKDCDALAQIAAFILSCGAVTLSGGRVALTLQMGNPRVIGAAFALVRRLTDSEPVMERVSRQGRRDMYAIAISDAAQLLRLCFDYDGGLFFARAPRAGIIDRECCKKAFLRGAFLGCGFARDPQREYHVEFDTGSEQFAGCLVDVLNAFDLNPRMGQRRGRYVVYLKSSESISAFFSLAGAHSLLLNFENIRIIKDMRNRANRQTNCDSANLNRTCDAAGRQLDAIRLIERVRGLDSLPEGLKVVAEARLNNPEATLNDLNALLGPKLSRSGLNHRLNRLIKIADDLSR